MLGYSEEADALPPAEQWVPCEEDALTVELLRGCGKVRGRGAGPPGCMRRGGAGCRGRDGCHAVQARRPLHATSPPGPAAFPPALFPAPSPQVEEDGSASFLLELGLACDHTLHVDNATLTAEVDVGRRGTIEVGGAWCGGGSVQGWDWRGLASQGAPGRRPRCRRPTLLPPRRQPIETTQSPGRSTSPATSLSWPKSTRGCALAQALRVESLHGWLAGMGRPPCCSMRHAPLLHARLPGSATPAPLSKARLCAPPTRTLAVAQAPCQVDQCVACDESGEVCEKCAEPAVLDEETGEAGQLRTMGASQAGS